MASLSLLLTLQTGNEPHEAGIGAGVDSFFEYLVKGYVLFNNRRLLKMWRNLEVPIERFLNDKDWYVWANMKTGSTTQKIAQSLDGFLPGKFLSHPDILSLYFRHENPTGRNRTSYANASELL